MKFGIFLPISMKTWSSLNLFKELPAENFQYIYNQTGSQPSGICFAKTAVTAQIISHHYFCYEEIYT